MVLFTATLFAICSAFPIHEETMGCQQFCTTVTHRCSHCAVSAYVHVCHTPEIGKTYTHSNNNNCMYLEYASPTYFQKMPTHYRMSRNLPSECAPNAGIRPIPNYSMQLFDIAELSERRLYLDLCTMFKIVHGLFNFPSRIFNTYSGRTQSANELLLFHRPFARTS